MNGPSLRRTWPFFSTPFVVFATVIGLLGGMMLLLAVLPGMPGWLRWTAGIVAAVSGVSLYRGYGRRIEATPLGVCYRSLVRRIEIPWDEVRAVDRYVPLDRNLTTKYVYISRLETPPVDWREIDENTIQLQDRPGLLETLQKIREDVTTDAAAGNIDRDRSALDSASRTS